MDNEELLFDLAMSLRSFLTDKLCERQTAEALDDGTVALMPCRQCHQCLARKALRSYYAYVEAAQAAAITAAQAQATP